ncbi:MAG: hypothetical protein CVU19_12200 [Betaproteobacteria bacterium HGW-Betaproteobacteria-13]|uniref:Uncharacterized protein n=1 Tax=Parazoarcus communis TaxID=41977 RepID=A0A2U8H4F0_9RHOO|nr:hypothetical protein CEW87_15510 [Parazoarcus communis]PKO80471.1 MAG: hypothetical protein CVU19_12200 [Betaproteobacteria bacterium HGW-Betaproteobacteria-13]
MAVGFPESRWAEPGLSVPAHIERDSRRKQFIPENDVAMKLPLTLNPSVGAASQGSALVF